MNLEGGKRGKQLGSGERELREWMSKAQREFDRRERGERGGKKSCMPLVRPQQLAKHNARKTQLRRTPGQRNATQRIPVKRFTGINFSFQLTTIQIDRWYLFSTISSLYIHGNAGQHTAQAQTHAAQTITQKHANNQRVAFTFLHFKASFQSDQSTNSSTFLMI